MNQPAIRAHGIQHQLSRCGLKESGVRRGGAKSYNITTHSTRPAIAWLSWCFLAAQVGCCSRGRVNSGVGQRKAETLSYIVELKEYDCGRRRYRARKTLMYDSRGHILLSDVSIGEWDEPPPDTSVENMMETACKIAP